MPYVSDAQRRFFHSPGAKRAGISKATVKEFDRASKGRRLPEKKKKKTPTIKVDNKLKGAYGETNIENGKAVSVKINVKRHKSKEELADTIKHELLHVKHPKMHEKTVYKKVPKNIPPKEQDKLIAKLRMKNLNYKSGAVKRKLKIGPVKTAPGELISKSRAVSQRMRVGMMGM